MLPCTVVTPFSLIGVVLLILVIDRLTTVCDVTTTVSNPTPPSLSVTLKLNVYVPAELGVNVKFFVV